MALDVSKFTTVSSSQNSDSGRIFQCIYPTADTATVDGYFNAVRDIVRVGDTIRCIDDTTLAGIWVTVDAAPKSPLTTDVTTVADV